MTTLTHISYGFNLQSFYEYTEPKRTQNRVIHRTHTFTSKMLNDLQLSRFCSFEIYEVMKYILVNPSIIFTQLT